MLGVFSTARGQATGTMRDLFRALTDLLPFSLSAEQWESAANRSAVETGLAALADESAAIEAHGLGLNPSYDRARAALAAYAAEAQESYESGDALMSRFVVRNLTENCFACHSRLPAAEVPDLGWELREAVDLAAMEPDDRLRLLVATRQFATVLDEAEAILRDPTLTATDIDMLGVFETYLKIAVRVSRDYERPRQAMWAFLQRDDLPMYLADQVGDWIVALDDLGRFDLEISPRAGADLLREASARNEYLRDRRGLVHAIVASSLLHQFLQTAPEDPLAEAEAYYHLGVAEAAISRTTWLPETEFFLESAIRAAPGSSHARNAYAFLEQYVLASYTGSSGTSLPDDVLSRLADLRELVEGN
jgi:hypothetical protein